MRTCPSYFPKSSSQDSSKSILFIDDNPDIRETFKALLEGEGYSVVTASNGEEGLELLERLGEPAVIFLDLNMPVMNGREFLEARRTTGIGAGSPVIIFAATRSAEGLEGTAAWIRKPVDYDVLMDVVERYCG